MRRFFEFARKWVDADGKRVLLQDENGNYAVQYEDAKLPEYSTKSSAGADFFCAEEVTIPSLLESSLTMASIGEGNSVNNAYRGDLLDMNSKLFKPTMVHTGIKAKMKDDEVLYLFNRSSNPGKLGLMLANGVGVIDADYYGNTGNDGEIMFAFYNLGPLPITLHVGDKIGQGVFQKFLKAENATVLDKERAGGFGSTDK
jgi:dUTP pyrophosphatase